MGLGLLNVFNKVLHSRGLVIKDRNVYEEELEPVKYKWLQQLNINTILDVGASDGGYAKKARKIFPEVQIYSFEPLPVPFSRLSEKFKNDSKHKAFNLVLSDKTGEVTFFQNDRSGSSSMIETTNKHVDAYPETANSKKITVKSDMLDNIVPQLDLKENILLKIDVQGAESFVLQGAKKLLPRVKVIFLEMSFIELYKGQWLFNDMYQFLIQNNFQLAGVENVSQNVKTGSFLQMDSFFVNNNLS